MASPHHRMTAASDQAFRDIEEQQRYEYHRDDERVAHRVLVKVGYHIKNLHRNQVAVLEDQRGAEIGKCPDENDDRAGKISRKHQRKRDRTKKLEPARSHVAGRFLNARIDIRQSSGEIQIHYRVEMEDFEHDDAAETSAQPVNGL